MTINDKGLPGFTAAHSLKSSSDDYAQKTIREFAFNKPGVTPQGCCVSGPFGICLVSSPLCP